MSWELPAKSSLEQDSAFLGQSRTGFCLPRAVQNRILPAKSSLEQDSACQEQSRTGFCRPRAVQNRILPSLVSLEQASTFLCQSRTGFCLTLSVQNRILPSFVCLEQVSALICQSRTGFCPRLSVQNRILPSLVSLDKDSALVCQSRTGFCLPREVHNIILSAESSLHGVCVCDPPERRQLTAPAEGGKGRGGVGSTRPAVETILRQPDTIAYVVYSIYNIVTLRLKYTHNSVCREQSRTDFPMFVQNMMPSAFQNRICLSSAHNQLTWRTCLLIPKYLGKIFTKKSVDQKGQRFSRQYTFKSDNLSVMPFSSLKTNVARCPLWIKFLLQIEMHVNYCNVFGDRGGGGGSPAIRAVKAKRQQL